MHSAAWLRSMDSASTYLHPDFGPNHRRLSVRHPVHRRHEQAPDGEDQFEYASESYRGRYPFGPDTPIEGGKSAGGDRHAIMVNSHHLHAVRAVGCPVLAARLDSGLRRDVAPERPTRCARRAGRRRTRPGCRSCRACSTTPRSGRRSRPGSRSRTRSGSPPADHERGLPVARPARGGLRARCAKLPPMGARFRLKASFSVARFCRNSQRVLPGRQGRAGGDAELRPDPRRQRQQLVLPGQRLPAVAGRAGVAAQGDPGERVPGGQ